MTDPNYTDISFVLDRSGSMASIREATIAGFDAFMAEQRTAEGRCTVSLAQFDDKYDVIYTEVDVHRVPGLRLEPRGTTALLDAIARTVHATGARLAAKPEDQRPGTVIVGIMTDGYENASREYTHAMIKQLITEQEQKYDWTFLYLGANQDAVEVGSTLGVQSDRSLTYSSAGTADALRASSANVGRMRKLVREGAAPAAARAAAAYTSDQREQANRAGEHGRPDVRRTPGRG